MALSQAIVADRVPVHELESSGLLRALDAMEHNMERLNARARGSGRTYHAIVLEGPLARAPLERALDALASRHPLLRMRVVRGGDGKLWYAATRGERADGTARLPVSYLLAADLSAWPQLVEADMNAGAVASERGPLFAFAVIEPPGLEQGASGRRVLVMVGHHAVCDGTSSVALLHELLEQLERPHSPTRLEDRALVDPFCLDLPVPELPELEAALRDALAQPDAGRQQRLETLLARLEQLERDLLARKDGAGRLPVALAPTQRWLASLNAELRPARGIVPEVEVAGAGRYERVRTALLHHTLGAEPTLALRRAAKQQGLTLNGAFAAAVLLALAAERGSGATLGAASERLALASAVSLRNQLVPPLSAHDLRIAVDVVVSRLTVSAGDRFWDLARRAGEDVTRAVASGRALSSYFGSVPRDFGDTPPGVALPLLSNLGKAQLATQYGPLRVLELSGAMATHGSFQLAMLFLSFDERLSASFYCETPSVSRAALERFADRVLGTLNRVARGEEPVVPG